MEIPEDKSKNLAYSKLSYPLLQYVDRIKKLEKQGKVQNVPVLEKLFGKLCLHYMDWDGAKKKDENPSSAVNRSHKHIHPCICDMTKQQWEKIKKYRDERDRAQLKFEHRIVQIEEELRVIEEQEEEKRRQDEDFKDAWSETYDVDEKGKVRRHRSARRVSMVSLGVKQVINWRKSPRYAVKMNRAQMMRKRNKMKTCSLTQPAFPDLPKLRSLSGGDVPLVRSTKAVELRDKYVKKWISDFDKVKKKPKYPNKPEFTVNKCMMYNYC